MSASPEEKIHYQTFTISDLPTRSVTIYPQRAAIVRDIDNVVIKPGRTEITITNLTPLADEHSIKVEGHGTDAVVTDMTVDSVPNRAVAADVSDSSDSSESEDESPLQSPDLRTAISTRKSFESELDRLNAERNSITAREAYLKKSMDYRCDHVPEPPKLGEYESTRLELFQDLLRVQGALANIEPLLVAARKREARLQKAFDRERRKPREARRQRNLARMDRKAEKRAQQLELPTTVYRVRITLELESLPAQTKSIVATALTGKPRKKEDDEIKESTLPYLRISYITTGASWMPHYDLRLDTTKRSGTLTYRANYTNSTLERWKDAKITLSTSQNTFSGLEDKVPWMGAWNVTLANPGYNNHDGGLLSPAERQIRDAARQQLEKEVSKAQGTVFAVPTVMEESPFHSPFIGGHGGGGGATKSPWGGVTRSASKSSRKSKRYSTRSSPKYEMDDDDDESDNDEGPGGSYDLTTEDYGGSSTKDLGRLRVATSSSESHGMTTIYELPGVRTITSSKLLRRHVITELELPAVEFSHMSVPKLRASVFLKARIWNRSTVSFLRGKAGLTLDGSFMGNTSIPLCVPSNHFDVGLGVDESIQVQYSKPSKKSSSQGMIMMKEHVVNYSRSIRIHNARAGPVKLLLFDQVPVSDDERLRINLVQPRGLRTENDSVAVGAGGKIGPATAVGAPKMGSATLRKNGEIWWELNMEDGGDVVLPVEYEARMPQGMVIRAK